MSEKAFKIINNVIYAVFIIITVYTLADIYLLNDGFSTGVCPVENNRPLLYLAIAMAVMSFVFPYFKKYITTKGNKQEII